MAGRPLLNGGGDGGEGNDIRDITLGDVAGQPTESPAVGVIGHRRRQNRYIPATIEVAPTDHPVGPDGRRDDLTTLGAVMGKDPVGQTGAFPQMVQHRRDRNKKPLGNVDGRAR